jgi:hypothetical protein
MGETKQKEWLLNAVQNKGYGDFPGGTPKWMDYFMEKTNLEMDENWGYPHDKADTSKNEQSSKPDM